MTAKVMASPSLLMQSAIALRDAVKPYIEKRDVMPQSVPRIRSSRRMTGR